MVGQLTSIVRNWEFIPPSQLSQAERGDAKSLLMRRRSSSAIVADLPGPRLPSEIKSGGGPKRPPTVFKEPEGSSLLDSFGF